MRLKVRLIDLIIYVMLLLPDQFCYLINKDIFQSSFKIQYRDFTLVCYVLIFMYVFFRYKPNLMSRCYHFKWIFLWIIPMSIIAAFISNRLFDQSFILGFMVQRTFFVLPIIYFTFRTLVIKKVVTWEKLLHMIYIVGILSLILCVIQYFVYDNIVFLDATFRNRNGLRIRSNFGYPLIVVLISFNELLKTESRKIKVNAVSALILTMFFEIFIMQTRLEIVGLAAAALVMIILNRENISKKLFWLLLAILSGTVFMFTELGQFLISGLSSISSGQDLRVLGRVFYIEKIAENPIWGYGYPHESCKAAETAAGYYIYDSWGFGLSDYGIIGFSYIYGIAGGIWYLWFHLKMALISFKSMRNRYYIFLPYIAYLFTVMINLTYWYWHMSAAFVIIVVIASLEEFGYKNKNDYNDSELISA